MMAKGTGLALGVVLLLAASAANAAEAMVIAKACGADIDRFCQGVPPGEGRIKACVKAHVMELSAPCFDAILGAVASGKEPNESPPGRDYPARRGTVTGWRPRCPASAPRDAA